MEQEKKQRKQNPWLSVIIPIYNAEKYLDDCLLSIARQDFKDYEVILIDDGSTDDSEKICNFYTKKDERFKYFKIKNSGSYVARIKGIQKTKGNYFTFCDSDDFYNRQAFSIIYDNLKNSKAEVLEFGYLKKFNHIKKRVRYCESKLLINQDDFIANEYPKLLCSRWENSHIDMLLWNKVYKHNLKDKIMATDDDRVFFGDDQILNLQLLENCNSILIIPNYLYFYRQGSGFTNKYSKNTLKDINTIKEWQLRFINRGEYQKEELLYKNLFGELAGCNNTKGIIYRKVNNNWLLVLQLVKKLEESDYNIKVGRTIFQKICYVLSRYGTDMGMRFTKGTYGPYCPEIKDMITILSNNNLISEREYGKMMLITVSKDFKINKALYSKEDIENVNKTFQLFKRIKDTNQAELITTILYSYDILKETHDHVTENMIYSYIVEWKKRLNDHKNEMRIRELTKSLTGMKLIDTDYTKDYVENIFF